MSRASGLTRAERDVGIDPDPGTEIPHAGTKKNVTVVGDDAQPEVLEDGGQQVHRLHLLRDAPPGQ